jgi:hypothetical protein
MEMTRLFKYTAVLCTYTLSIAWSGIFEYRSTSWVNNKRVGNSVGEGKRAFGLIAFDDTG